MRHLDFLSLRFRQDRKDILNTYRILHLEYWLRSVSTMKFNTLSQCKTGARLGCLSEFSKQPDLSLETPLLFLHTKTGSVPYLSCDTFQLVSKAKGVLQIDLASHYDAADSIQQFGKGVSKFVGLPAMLSYMSLYDPATSSVPGYNHAAGISLWRRNGRVVLNPDDYFTKLEAISPDIFEVMADCDTGLKTAEKRAAKAVERSLRYLEKVEEKLAKSQRLRNSAYFVPITGGDNLRNRSRSIQAARESNCSGFILSGLCTTGPALEDAELVDVKEIITATLEALNTPDRVRIFPGPISPLSIIELVELGVDIFDSSLPYILTERGCAFVFKNSLDSIGDKENRVGQSEDLSVNGNVSSTQEKEESGKRTVKPYEIDVNHPRFRDDFRPLVPGCNCHACRKHTRAYINHLLNVKELLGPILLMMHNLHHYLKFFESIRNCIRDDTLDQLKKEINTSIV